MELSVEEVLHIELDSFGKIRKSRITKKEHFEGALSALDLIRATKDEEDDKVYVTLTEKGKKFFLMDNPVIQGEYEKGPLSKEESDFILKELRKFRTPYTTGTEIEGEFETVNKGSINALNNEHNMPWVTP